MDMNISKICVKLVVSQDANEYDETKIARVLVYRVEYIHLHNCYLWREETTIYSR